MVRDHVSEEGFPKYRIAIRLMSYKGMTRLNSEKFQNFSFPRKRLKSYIEWIRKNQEFILVIIFVIFPQKWQFRLKNSKFLGIQPRYNQYLSMLRSNSRSQRKHFVFVSKFSIRVSFLGRARVSMTNRLGELSMTRWYPTESDSEVSPGLLIAGSEIILKIKYFTWSKICKSLYNNKLYFSIDENLDIYLGCCEKTKMAAYLFSDNIGIQFQVFKF